MDALNSLTSSALKTKTVKFTASGYAIDGAEIDAVVNSSVSMSNNITSNPVEFGFSVTDNVVINPVTIRLTAVVSEYDPNLNLLTNPVGTIEAETKAVANKVESFFSGNSSSTSENRASRFLDNLIELKNLVGGTTFDLYIYPKTYRNLVVESLSYSDSASLGQSIKFTLVVREIQIAKTSIRQSAPYNPQDGAFSLVTKGGLLPNKVVDIVNNTENFIGSLF